MPQALDSRVQKADFREMPIFLAFFSWWLKDIPAKILYIGEKSTKRAFGFFSINLLLKSLFLPWKRDEIDTSNMALEDKARVLMMNLVSRLVGAVVRAGTIFVGLVIISVTFIASLLGAVGFILLPFIFIYLIINALII